jgi:uncharacterized membrane protein YkoI
MRLSIKQSGMTLAAVSSLALAGGGIAAAATRHPGAKPAAARAGGNPKETALTGTTLTQASDAALAAVPGASVRGASIEDPSDTSGAAYEVHVTKADGTPVQVLEDSAFKVLSTKADAGHGPGGPGGPGGGNPNEAVLTGSTLTQASDAALVAVPGGKVDRASAEDKSDASGAAYEVHVTKADGSRVEVLEDSAFKVLSVKADAGHGPGGPGRGGH